ncbi:MAG: 50S ribosomal protein L15 [Candidatus Collierbacteria bacterium GW2011_GWF2_44_15]|uniref:Large ribosomal subunit protein uL15 n=5 Tax=Candidatus Collieribacteriota TaxID=1752725 RepID=A0A0G1HKY5_9BACT|nr:MAG: 50S ribosomal protein L15 [Candidatus Collierbacteria bacterium GW2011_GWA1_44_12]KKT39424.1 MAG: 50S ribosomal protein L15 [Candidatus Collierbacteria bacterium GW2011_GWF1_44_12]KKT47243.1 MAG: 50S ribosomal protein L15 [Candidatus Collierbacteria bacterium GW2011_GWF2_44_15]KKU00407.1 MAG: 50S ribosomal protein L15 [Candidatus Collierbacteria bacterium GW2011_GWC2_45_15]KKU30557.1 MAG: 50S ribosomal protein L15 [Candidatus Collierbacteria bacterium GW2011_GWE1_46_18]
MLLASLPKSTLKSKKRLGRGFGSGVGGHTVGRGQKGQKTRGTIPAWFEGGQLPIVRRTPFIKGKHRFQSIYSQPIVVNLDFLSKFADNTVVDAKLLSESLKLNEKESKRGFKIVATGKIEKPLEIAVLATAGAVKLIEKAGGKYSFAK